MKFALSALAAAMIAASPVVAAEFSAQQKAAIDQQIRAFRRAVRRQIEGSDYQIIHCRDIFGGFPVCKMADYHEAKVVLELARSRTTFAS